MKSLTLRYDISCRSGGVCLNVRVCVCVCATHTHVHTRACDKGGTHALYQRLAPPKVSSFLISIFKVFIFLLPSRSSVSPLLSAVLLTVCTRVVAFCKLKGKQNKPLLWPLVCSSQCLNCLLPFRITPLLKLSNCVFIFSPLAFIPQSALLS